MRQSRYELFKDIPMLMDSDNEITLNEEDHRYKMKFSQMRGNNKTRK
jgi:hypothetical protein